MPQIPRPEYPRPDFARKGEWLNLNGTWDFDFDDANVGDKESWQVRHAYSRKITVPFPFQAPLSGIGDWNPHDRVWYHRTFNAPQRWQDMLLWLRFGAVDWETRVFLNGRYVGCHQGGYLPFQFEVSQFLRISQENDLTLAVFDPTTDKTIPRGKQVTGQVGGIFYPRQTGIWQTIWLEPTPDVFLAKVQCIPQPRQSQVVIVVEMEGAKLGVKPTLSLKIHNSKGQCVFDTEQPLKLDGLEIPAPLPNFEWWSLSKPNLYKVTSTLKDPFAGDVLDEVETYFGMRDFAARDKRVFLNDEDLYLKFFLVQGYWGDGGYTAPTDDSFVGDLKEILAYGFNGLRMHQKIEDPRFLYHCDRLGVLIWDELPNGYEDPDNRLFHRNLGEMAELIRRDYNHPAVMTWTFFNESWGVPHMSRVTDQAKCVAAYNFMKGMDHTRFANDNDGWEHCRSDLDTVHLYVDNSFFDLFPLRRDEIDADDFNGLPMGRVNYVRPYQYDGTPLLITEMGGFWYVLNGESYGKAQGYGLVCKDPADLEDRVIAQVEEWKKRSSWVRGIVYTELYDQYSEVNGFLTMSRKRKFPPEKLKRVMDSIK